MANKVWKVRNYSIEEKAAIINTILGFQKANKWFNDSDLAYIVKELLENGKVYISKAALNVIKINDPNYKRFWGKYIITWEKGEPVCEYLQPKTHKTRKLWGESCELVWEHVVPTQEFLKKLKQHKFEFSDIDKFGIVCIVLKHEDNCLTQLKLRDKMPKDWDGKEAWARYIKAKIEVVGDPFKIEK